MGLSRNVQMPAPRNTEHYDLWKRAVADGIRRARFHKWLNGCDTLKRTPEHQEKINRSLRRVCRRPEHRRKLSRIAKQRGYGKWMKGRRLLHITESNKRRGGRSYEELYGDRADEEREKRSKGNLNHWKSIPKRKQRNRHNGEAKYKRWRLAVFKRDNYTCQKCSRKGGKLNAHHIKSWSRFPKLRYVLSNGITLCERDHKKVHKRRA